MEYNDSLLDVNAFLQFKIKRNLDESQKIAADFLEIKESFDEMNGQINELYASVLKIAEELGVELPDVEEFSAREDKNDKNNDIGNHLHIKILASYDYSATFRKLLKEAHEQGFVNVHPESILTEEEMSRAKAFDDALDNEFAERTKLNKKDIEVLIVAVAIRVLYFYIMKLFVQNKKSDLQNKATVPFYTAEPVVIDAVQNVDIEKINGTEDVKQLLYTLGGFINLKTIKSEGQILNDDLPFDLQDNEFFMRKDILAYHPMVGWLIGIINILTDTVTTSKMESFSVVKSLYDDSLHLSKENTLGVLLPVMFDFSKNKDSLLAAVVRQADALKVTAAPLEDVSAMLKETIAVEEKNNGLLGKVDLFSQIIPFDISFLNFGEIFRDAAITAFLNKLITAIHAVRYDPKTDDDLRMYTVRTNKIIAISSAIVASLNNLPALITQDALKVDISSVVMALVAMFNSTKFWIHAKADYLVSEYKVKIDEAFSQIDKYFEIIPDENT